RSPLDLHSSPTRRSSDLRRLTASARHFLNTHLLIVACVMSRRSRAREVALQILFEDDVNPRDSVEALTSFVSARLNSPEMEDFCMSIILGVRRNQAEIDATLNGIAQNWTVNRMAATDRNVLRLGHSRCSTRRLPTKW